MNLAIDGLDASFSKNHLAISCALTDVVSYSNPSHESFLNVEHFKKKFEIHVDEHGLFLSFKVKYPDKKLISPHDVLKGLHHNDQFIFLLNFGEVVVIPDVIPATSCTVEQPLSVLRKLKTYLRSNMGQDCLSHLRLLDQNTLVLYFESGEKSEFVNFTLAKVNLSLSY